MREETKTVVESLYALRAGISLVAEQVDFVDKIKEDEARDTLGLNLEIEKANSQIEEHKNEFLKKSSEYKKEKIDYEEKIKSGEGLKKPTKITMKQCILISASVVGIMLIVMLAALSSMVSANELIIIIVGNIVFFGLLVLLCKGLAILFDGDYKRRELEYENKKKEYEELLAKSPVTDEAIEEKTDASRNEMDEKIRLQENKIAEAKHLIDIAKSNAQDNVEKYTYEGKRIYSSLESQFSCILDTRDWESLDFIIYLLETGRAESVKEALQQLDFHRQTDKIAEAVNNASRSICDRISTANKDIEKAIEECASKVEAQLLGINGRLRGMSIYSAMQSILLLKSTINSSALVKSARSIVG